MSTQHPPPFLDQLGPADAAELLQRARRRTIEKSQPILWEGSAGDEVVIILRGRVKFVASGADGREVVLAIRGPGELFGEMAALGGIRRTATVSAVDRVEVAYLRGDELRSFLSEHPSAALVLMRMLVFRWAEADRDRISLATQDSVGRLAQRLLDLASQHGVRTDQGLRIELTLSQDELASWTGATRETISRALRLMRRLGWVLTENRAITIVDAKALRERAGRERSWP